MTVMLVMAVASAAGITRAAEPAADARPVRVMSFNIRYGTAADGDDAWPRRRYAVIGVIREFDPDLLGMQEVLAFQRDELAAALPGWEAVAAGRDDGRNAGEMTPVLFRTARFEQAAAGHLWLSDTPDVAGSRGWDAALPRIATWVRLRDRSDPGGREVLLLNTHFDHRGQEARLRSARLLRDWLRDAGRGCRVVLTGDFNTAEGSEPYKELFTGGEDRAGPLVDTLREASPQPGPAEGTFNRFDPTATTGPRIDWIGCSADWEVRLAGIDRTTHAGRTPSDHWPVTAVLRAARPEAAATLRVLSYNIHHGRGTDGVVDLPRLARVIRAADADLVALQEVDEQTTRSGGVDEAAELARLTGLRMGFGPQIDYLGGRYGQAILSRFPLGPATVHELPAVGGDRERRIAVAAEVDHPHGRLTFAGTHLHHRSEECRVAQARALIEAFAGAERCILVGDFNALPGSEPLAILDGAWQRVAAGDPPPTFPAGEPVRAIDHVFVRPAAAFDVLDLRVLDEPVASDHRPVLAILGWRPAAAPVP
ncbi:MAG: endonuclease/exonuclease/phosphatase family protein [Planctomycetaceae bacterium]